MLAAIDKDSDEDVPHTALSSPFLQAPTSTKTHIQPRQHSVDVEDDAREGQEGSIGSDSDVIAPRGKLAARLLAKNTTGEERQGDSDGGADSTNAYDRIKRQLIDGAPEADDQQSSNAEQKALSEDPILTRKFLLKRKKPIEVNSTVNEPLGNLTPQRQSSPVGTPSPATSINIRRSITPNLSAGLFLSPTAPKASKVHEDGNGPDPSDSDGQPDPSASSRLLLLVEKKRRERQAREAEEMQKRLDREKTAVKQSKKTVSSRAASSGFSDEDGDDDEAVGRRLTQQARPTRKASKKALEEMNRETQRMNRNMQLAHQAKTKKKIDKMEFLARFKAPRIAKASTGAAHMASSSTAVSSAPASDVDAAREHQTPPSSPAISIGESVLSHRKEAGPAPSLGTATHAREDEDELPTIEDLIAEASQPTDKGKGRAIDDHPLPEPKKPVFTKPPIKVKLSKDITGGADIDLDSDSDLEVMKASKVRSKRLDIFDKLQPKKATEGKSLHVLRALAHIASPGKQKHKGRPSMTPVEMQTSLQRRARQQAAQERAEKIQDLKDRGIIIQSAEERQRDQVEIEDLLEKARREGEEIMKKEKDAVRKEKRQNGEDVGSSDEDEDYEERGSDVAALEAEDEADDEEQEDNSDDLSEEEDEEENDEEGMEEDDEGNDIEFDGVSATEAKLIEAEASEDGQDEEDEKASDQDNPDEDEMDEDTLVRRIYRRKKGNRVLDDEDEDVGTVKTVMQMSPLEQPNNPLVPKLLGSDNAPMGLTQAFAATMAESQTQLNRDMPEEEYEQDSLALLRNLPKLGECTTELESTQTVIFDSQRESNAVDHGNTTQAPDIELHFSQSQIQYETPNLGDQDIPTATQYSDIPDPTQDVGFGQSSPFANRFAPAPPSTIDTVLLDVPAKDDSPVMKKKGRLRRRADAVPVLSKSDEEDNVSDINKNEFEISANAFDILKKAGKNVVPTVEAFDKKKSNARGMVEEQAEESEDEYAGLGGASDDESAGEEDEEVRKMIDEGEVNVDERELAAFYA